MGCLSGGSYALSSWSGETCESFGEGTSLQNPALRAQPWLNPGLVEQGTAPTAGATPAPSLHTVFSSLPYVQYGHCIRLILHLKDK